MRTALSDARMSMDTWTSLLTGVGTIGRDKRMSTTFQRAATLSYTAAEDLFHGDDIANRVARLPAMDRWREWVTYIADDVEAPVWIEQEHQRLHTVARLTEAVTWANVFGGSIVYVGAVDGNAPDQPLNLDAVKSVEFLTVFDRRDLHILTIDHDPLSAGFGEPELYQIRPVGGLRAPVRGAPITVHASRILRFDGTMTTKRRKARNLGWSDSLYQRIFERLRGYNSSWDAVEILLEDFSQAVFKIGGLREMLASKDGPSLLQARMDAAEMSRSTLRAMLLDAENEEFIRTPTPMSGLPEVIELFMLRIAAAGEMPVTLLFGRSPAGLNATGDNDLRQYYDRIRAEQGCFGRPQLERLSEILWATRKGGAPKNWKFQFNPLRQLSDDQVAQIHHSQAQADQLYWQMGYPAAKIIESRFTPEGFSMQTQPIETDLLEVPMDGEGAAPPVDDPEMTALLDSTGRLDAQATTAGGEEDNVQQQAFNGAQIQSMTETVSAVATGQLPRDSGVAILEAGFFLSRSEAERIIGEAGRSFVPVQAKAAPEVTTSKKMKDDDNDKDGDDQ